MERLCTAGRSRSSSGRYRHAGARAISCVFGPIKNQRMNDNTISTAMSIMIAISSTSARFAWDSLYSAV